MSLNEVSAIQKIRKIWLDLLEFKCIYTSLAFEKSTTLKMLVEKRPRFRLAMRSRQINSQGGKSIIQACNAAALVCWSIVHFSKINPKIIMITDSLNKIAKQYLVYGSRNMFRILKIIGHN